MKRPRRPAGRGTNLTRTLAALAATIALGAAAHGQALPGVGALPAADPVASAAAGAAAGAGAAPAKNLFSFFMLTPAQKAMCRAKFCASPAGQLVNNLLKPAAGLSGGLVGPICPSPLEPNPANLAKPADSPQGAAARIKAEEAQAGAKIADLEYLATKNCKRYPEAEAALINGLRAEKNECVRLAAARGLARGCCCTAKVVKALTLTVNGSTADGFPAEDSPRVRLAAFVALERCVANCAPAETAAPPEPPGKPAPPPEDVLPATYYTVSFAKQSAAEVFAEARAVLAAGITLPPGALAGPRSIAGALRAAPAEAPAPAPQPALAPGQPRSLLDVLSKAKGR